MLKLCTLASGSNGNSAYVSDGKTHLLIDAGISARAITRSLAELDITPDEIDAILITHEHSDHIKGLEVLEKKHPIPIYAAETTAQAIAEYTPALDERICRIDISRPMQIGDIHITSFRTPHDTEFSVGYKLTAGERSIVFATDLGHVPIDVCSIMCGADLVLLEANYDEKALQAGPYPYYLKKRIASDNGHLSNSDCAKCAAMAAQNGVKYLVLGHLSAENNSPRTAYDTVHRALMDAGFIPGVDIMLQVAPRGVRGNVYVLED